MPESSVTIEYKIQSQQFNDAIKGIKNDVKTLNKEFALQKEEMRLTGTETEQLQAKTEKLRKELKLADDVVEQTERGLQAARDAFGDNAKQTKEWADRLLDARKNQSYLENEIVSTEKKIDKLSGTIRKVDDSTAIKNVREDMRDLKEETGKTDNSVDGLDDGFKNILKGGAIGGIIGGVKEIGTALIGVINDTKELSRRRTSLNISLDFDDSAVQEVEDASRLIEAYGIDSAEALNGVRAQWQLNKNASKESNEEVIKGAAAIASAYDGIDFAELIQEGNEIAKSFEISNEEANALVLELLKVGFPPGQLDIISEYGTQLSMVGYTAEEIQALFEAGLETGTWNIDNLLDGVKEGRIKIAEFAQEIPEKMEPIIASMGFTNEEFQQLAISVKDGGEQGKIAFDTIATAINNMSDTRAKDEAGLLIYGTKWEDQGDKISTAIANADEKIVNMQANTQKMAEAIKSVDDDPAVRFESAMARFDKAMLPIKTGLLDIGASILELAVPIESNQKTVEDYFDNTALSAVTGKLIIEDSLYGTVNVIDKATGEIEYMTKEQFQAWKESTFKIKENTKTGYQEISDVISEKLSSASSRADSKLKEIPKSADSVMTSTKNKVNSAVSDMQRILSGMSWTVPKPTVPKFYVSGGFNLQTGAVPEILSWYATGGYSPNMSLIGIGEAGAEGIVPLEGKHMMPFADAVAQRMTELSQVNNNSTIININAELKGPQDYELLGRTIDKHLNTQSHEVRIRGGRA